MIYYDPGKWFGFHKLLQTTGGVTIEVMPRCLVSTVLVAIVHYSDMVVFPGSPCELMQFDPFTFASELLCAI